MWKIIIKIQINNNSNMYLKKNSNYFSMFKMNLK